MTYEDIPLLLRQAAAGIGAALTLLTLVGAASPQRWRVTAAIGKIAARIGCDLRGLNKAVSVETEDTKPGAGGAKKA